MNKMWRLLCWPGEKGEEEEEKEEEIVIPEDLHEEILQWLPSSVLIKLKLVCREWNRLISSPGFIQKHLERSKSRCNEPRILIPLLGHIDSYVEIVDYANDIIRNKICLGVGRMLLLGSCDGLVLYYIRYKVVALNPSTGKYYNCPSLSLSLCERGLKEAEDSSRSWLSWFGRHPCTGEYVLALATYKERAKYINMKVYSLPRNSLLCSSAMEVGMHHTYYSLQKPGTLLNGKLHFQITCAIPGVMGLFRSREGSFILVYDFETSKMERMRPPPSSMHSDHRYSLGVLNGCLCAILWSKGGYSIKVWMMKEYGVEESWSKYADFECWSMLRGLTIYGNVDVILRSSNFSTGSGPKLVDASREGKMVACFDSLVSPELVWSS